MWTAIIISLLGILIDIQSVDAKTCYYSRYGYITTYYRCLSSQYCCGTTSCCYYSTSSGGVYSLWYFWFCIILFFTICSGASGAYYRKRQRLIVRTHPAPTVQANSVQQTMVVSATASSGYSGYPHPPPNYPQPPPNYPQPPPTYNQVIANTGPNMGAAPYPSAAPPAHYNNPNQGVAVQHY